MQDLIQQYRESLRKVRKAKETANEVDRSILSGMESGLEFAIKWMETGRMPGSLRGVERLAAYQREIPVDPQRFPFEKYEEAFTYYDDYVPRGEISGEEVIKLNAALEALTDRQREVFLLYYREYYSLDEIAEELGIAKTSVQNHLERARNRLEKDFGLVVRKPLNSEGGCIT